MNPAYKKKLILPGIAILCGLALWLAVWGTGIIVQKRMQDFLTRHGVGGAVLTSYGHGGGGQIVFSDIKLDPDGFSTIGGITARLRWPYIFSSHPFSEIIIDKLSLTGEMDANGNFTFAGLNLAALTPLVETDSLIMNAGKVDLSTPAGDMRIDMKCRMTRQSDATQKIEAALFSDQKEFQMDSRWDANLAPDGKWKASAELHDMRLDLPRLVVSRMNGWLSAEGTLHSIAQLSGQADIGQLRIGDKSALNRVRITIDGPYDASHIILHGDISNHPDMAISADITRGADKSNVHISVEAHKIDDLLSFLGDLHNDLQKYYPHSSALTTLLLTPGNLERIRAEASKMTYNALILTVDGPPGSLEGKISLSWNGKTATGVIGMNPGEP